jgi:hypothetical protein
VKLIGHLSAMILAKSLIVSNENFCDQRAPMQKNGSFLPKILPSAKFDRSDTQAQSMLFDSI